MFYYTALSIAGSDCSGGAGIQADIKTMSALGVYAASAITSVTVQNTTGVESSYPIDSYTIERQIHAVMSDIRPMAIKTGMMGNKATVEAVVRALSVFYHGNLVVDPVMVSTSGSILLDNDAIETLCEKLLPMANIVTPNIHEAEILAGMKITNIDDMKMAARHIMKYGCKAVLVKGGHIDGDNKCDILVERRQDGIYEEHEYNGITIDSKNTHGTGCTLSSAIAAYLAQGTGIEESVKKAKEYVSAAIAAGADVCIGKGHGPVNHFFNPIKMKKINNK
jgi:hydroxymethylpyrimidine/phosphomethylpyrimidine kinase